jgi:hypothetical protein
MDSNTLPHMDRAKISRIARRKKQLTHLERLCVRPWVAEQLLSIGHKQLYHLLQTNQLESFKEGNARKITLASIEAYIARKLEKYPTKPKHARSE